MKRLSMFLFLFLAVQIVASAGNPIKFKSFKGFKSASPKSIKGNGGDFEEGVMIFSGGYGAPNMTGFISDNTYSQTTYTVTGLGPIHAKFEFAAADALGVGISFNYATRKVSYTSGGTTPNTESLDIMRTSINARINYHFYTENSVDIYTGVGFGYRFGTATYLYNGKPDPNFDNIYNIYFPIGFEMTIGARYYFSEMFGAYMEVGLARSIIQAGLVFKLSND
jgi:hypothetical protein